MTYDQNVLNATDEDRSKAFEWLRSMALGAAGKDWRKAAVALEEWARIKRIASERPQSEKNLDQVLFWLKEAEDALRQIRDECMNGHAYDIAVRALEGRRG